MTRALHAPTGRPPRALTIAEREELRAAFQRLAADEARIRRAHRASRRRPAVLALLVAIVAAALARAAVAADYLPAEITVYTYDGPRTYLGDLVAFRYGPDSAFVALREFGDGVFHDDFDGE